MADGRRYRAFLSYAHKDKAAGETLFRALDGYRPPKRLVGRETPHGPVPRRLYPVFRDREELPTSADLSARLRSALQSAEDLVVLCSPNAAQSRWVNEEIEIFRSLGKGDRIHAVLLTGSPEEAFPPALLDHGAAPIAADLRPVGDGWTDGPLKVLAGILGLSFGELKDREVARARLRARVNGSIAAVFALLAIGAGFAAWRAVQEAERANAALLAAVRGVETIADQVWSSAQHGGIRTPQATALLAAADGVVTDVVRLAPASPDLQQAQGRLLLAFARHHRTTGDIGAADQALARARGVVAEFEAQSDDPAPARRLRSLSLIEQGDTRAAAGDGPAALEAYQASLAIARSLAATAPGSIGAARDLANALDKIGAVKRDAGDGDAALAAFEESFEITRRLADQTPADGDLARDASFSLNNIGDARRATLDLSGALAAYEDSLEISRSLVDDDPTDPAAARDLAVSLERIGDLKRQMADPPGAARAYEESLAITRDLARQDPGNTVWIRDLAVALERLGDARRDLGDPAAAAPAYREALEALRGLVARDPSNTVWLRDLAVGLDKMGDAQLAMGARAAALAAFEEGLEISNRVAERDPSNAVWRRDLIISHVKIAEARPEAAADHYAAALAVADAMQAEGVLAPADAWMLGELATRLQDARGAAPD